MTGETVKMSNTTDDSLPKFKCACYPHFSCNVDSDFCLTDTTVGHVIVLLASLSSGVWLAVVTFIFFFSFLSFFSLHSINSVQLFSSLFSILHSFQISLNTVLPSHSWSFSPSLQTCTFSCCFSVCVSS